MANINPTQPFQFSNQANTRGFSSALDVNFDNSANLQFGQVATQIGSNIAEIGVKLRGYKEQKALAEINAKNDLIKEQYKSQLNIQEDAAKQLTNLKIKSSVAGDAAMVDSTLQQMLNTPSSTFSSNSDTGSIGWGDSSFYDMATQAAAGLQAIGDTAGYKSLTEKINSLTLGAAKEFVIIDEELKDPNITADRKAELLARKTQMEANYKTQPNRWQEIQNRFPEAQSEVFKLGKDQKNFNLDVYKAEQQAQQNYTENKFKVANLNLRTQEGLAYIQNLNTSTTLKQQELNNFAVNNLPITDEMLGAIVQSSGNGTRQQASEMLQSPAFQQNYYSYMGMKPAQQTAFFNNTFKNDPELKKAQKILTSGNISASGDGTSPAVNFAKLVVTSRSMYGGTAIGNPNFNVPFGNGQGVTQINYKPNRQGSSVGTYGRSMSPATRQMPNSLGTGTSMTYAGQSLKITGGYGDRTHPLAMFNKGVEHSGGLDIVGKNGYVPIPFDGVVRKIGYDKRSGNYIQIANNGQVLNVFHVDDLTIGKFRRGQRIQKGYDMVGHKQLSGAGTGPHIKLLLKNNGIVVDPSVLFMQ